MLLNITEYVIFWRVCKISGLKFLCSHKCENRNWLQRGFHESEYRLRLYFCSLEKKKKTSAKKVYFYGHGFYLLLITNNYLTYKKSSKFNANTAQLKLVFCSLAFSKS